jgi:hypothetical protein
MSQVKRVGFPEIQCRSRTRPRRWRRMGPLGLAAPAKLESSHHPELFGVQLGKIGSGRPGLCATPPLGKRQTPVCIEECIETAVRHGSRGKDGAGLVVLVSSHAQRVAGIGVDGVTAL